jgi:hypothetical protein
LKKILAGDDVGANRVRNKIPSVVGEQGSNLSSMARRQFGSMRATRTEEDTGDKVDAEVADRVSLSVGSQKPLFARVVIG